MRMGPGESVEEETRLAGRTQGHPRDLLRQFSGGVVLREGKPPPAPSGGTEEDSGEIELSLGLSLGGCFGVDTARKKGLQRSSSIAAIPFSEHGEEVEGHAISPLLLKRTASLPAEAKEEQRKRRELQCLEPMEAKRKRSERDNGSGTWATDPASPPVPEGDARRAWWARPAPEHLGPWWTPNRIAADGICGGSSAAAQWVKPFAASSQGSVGSQGSSSSGVSDFGSRPPKQEELPGNGTTHRRCLSGTQLPPGITERNGPAAVKTPKSNAAAGWEEEVEAPRKDEQQSLAAGGTVGRPNGSKAGMQDMPSVSTRGGGGPNGKLVEGFLYKYGAGEEVRIMCVCHGRFLSPAEFVRHAGGGDVTHPLRHIIVNTTPSCYP